MSDLSCLESGDPGLHTVPEGQECCKEAVRKKREKEKVGGG